MQNLIEFNEKVAKIDSWGCEEFAPILGCDIEFLGKTIQGKTVLPQGNYLNHFDGPLLEIRPDAADCREEVYANIRDCFHDLRSDLGATHLDTSPIVAINKEDYKEKDLLLGCSPSGNAYDLKGRYRRLSRSSFRTCGGHIHFGVNPICEIQGKSVNNWTKHDDIMTMRPRVEDGYWDDDEDKHDWLELVFYYISKRAPEKFIKALDRTVGIVGVAIQEKPEDAATRRKYYGLPGEYRVKPYGFEYRALPTNELLKSKYAWYMIMELARLAVTDVIFAEMNGSLAETQKATKDIEDDGIIRILSQYDQEAARELTGKIIKDTPLYRDLPYGYMDKILYNRGIGEISHADINGDACEGPLYGWEEDRWMPYGF